MRDFFRKSGGSGVKSAQVATHRRRLVEADRLLAAADVSIERRERIITRVHAALACAVVVLGVGLATGETKERGFCPSFYCAVGR